MFIKKEHKTVKEKIKDTCEEYFKQNDEEIVIYLKPKSFCILRQEMWNGLIENKNGFFIIYENKKIPILIEESMPGDMEMVIESRKSYEERELEKIYSKFYSLFESWKWDI